MGVVTFDYEAVAACAVTSFSSLSPRIVPLHLIFGHVKMSVVTSINVRWEYTVVSIENAIGIFQLVF